MGTKNFAVEVSSQASSSDASDEDRHQLALNGKRVSVRVDGVFAAVEGADESALAALDTLERAFRRGGPADAMIPGDEGVYVARVLGQMMSPVVFPAGVPAVALVVSMDRDVVLACSGGSRVYVCRDDGIVDEQEMSAHDVSPAGVHMARVRLEPTDCLVLAGPSVAKSVVSDEVEQTVRASFSADDAAAWLTNLATGRGGSRPSVLVVQYSPALALQGRFEEQATSVRHWPAALLVVAAMLAALVVAAVIFAPKLMHGSQAATPDQAPTGLYTRQASAGEASVAWLPLPGATGYVVSVAHRHIHSAGAHLVLRGVLTPGVAYHWRVRAEFANRLGPSSAPASLLVPLPPFIDGPHALGPVGLHPAGYAKRATFCWTSVSTAQSFELYVTGASLHIHRSISRSNTSAGPRGAVCVKQAVRAGKAYAWQVGAAAPGYRDSWTHWKYFQVAGPHTRTHAGKGSGSQHRTSGTAGQNTRPSTQPPVYVQPPTATAAYIAPTATPYYVPPTAIPAYQPVSGTSNNQQVNPPQTYATRAPLPTTAPAPTPGVVHFSVPQPTAVVRSCSNPPNCG